MEVPSVLLNGMPDTVKHIFKKEWQNLGLDSNISSKKVLQVYKNLKKMGIYRTEKGWIFPQKTLRIAKLAQIDEEKRQIFGFFSVVEEFGTPLVDLQGDTITEKELEDSAYRYVRFSRVGDERHDQRAKAVLIESMVLTKEKQKVLGIDLGYVGWWGGFQVLDNELWEKIKNKEYKSFSIGGVGEREGLY